MRTFNLRAGILLSMLGVMWAVQIFSWLDGGGLIHYGILPREMSGLRGIIFAPILHGSFMHLIANSVPFLILGSIVMLRGLGDFAYVTITVMLVGGFGTWAIGAPHSVHVGASSLIFGYMGFLVSCGYFERKLVSLLVSMAVGAVYGGLIVGVLPGQPGISWEGHLFGLIGGVLAAKSLAVGRSRRLH